MTEKDRNEIIAANLEAAVIIEQSKQIALKWIFENPQHYDGHAHNHYQAEIRFQLRISEAVEIRIRDQARKYKKK